MKDNNSRRLFLRNSILAGFGVALFSQGAAASTLLGETTVFDTSKIKPKKLTDLRKSSFLGKHVTIKGQIFDSLGTTALSDATVEVWHLSPNSTKYSHKAKLQTNSAGEYQFITDFPEREKGKSSRINFKVSKDRKEYTTDLMINDLGANISGKHWEKNKQLGNKLFPIKEGAVNSSTITFNISI